MKIAVLTADYPPHLGGGVGSLAYELARGLVRLNHEVVVVTRWFMIDEVFNDGNYKVHYLMAPRMPPKDVWYYILRMHRVRSILLRERPDVIHDLGVFTGFQPWVTRIAPTVFSVQGSPQLGLIRRMLGFWDNLRSILFEIAHRLPPTLMGLLKRPEIALWVYISRFVMMDTLAWIRDEELRRRMLNKSMIVYNGVDVNALRRVRDKVVRELGVDEHSIVFIGRLMEYKGVKFLVRAFRHVVNEVPDAKLHIIGDGPIYGDIRNLIVKLGLERNVTMHGALPRPKAMEVLAESAVLTHPSLYESFGMVISEAYAMGKPVITHRAGYAVELVEEPKAGLVVNVLNEEEYANAMITLLTDKDLYNKFSQRASLFAEEKLSVEAMVNGYVNAYKRAINNA